MNADQVSMFVHQLMLFTNVFLHLMLECKKKAYTCNFIKEAVSKAVKNQLTGRSRSIFRILTLAFALIFY